jgi:NDP-sugar pyrophosphorylase family protein
MLKQKDTEMIKNIPVVILCGGMGSRLAEYTEVRPKPLVEVGGKPILWHIMKHYAQYGFNEFILALGYKGEQIKRYFLDFYSLNQDFTVSLNDGDIRSIPGKSTSSIRVKPPLPVAASNAWHP